MRTRVGVVQRNLDNFLKVFINEKRDEIFIA